MSQTTDELIFVGFLSAEHNRLRTWPPIEYLGQIDEVSNTILVAKVDIHQCFNVLWHGHRRLGLLLSNLFLSFRFGLRVEPFEKAPLIFLRPAPSRMFEWGVVQNFVTSIFGG